MNLHCGCDHPTEWLRPHVSCLSKSSGSYIEQEVTVPLFDAMNPRQLMESETAFTGILCMQNTCNFPTHCFLLKGKKCGEKKHVSGFSLSLFNQPVGKYPVLLYLVQILAQHSLQCLMLSLDTLEGKIKLCTGIQKAEAFLMYVCMHSVSLPVNQPITQSLDNFTI